jgi:hypothetical protein
MPHRRRKPVISAAVAGTGCCPSAFERANDPGVGLVCWRGSDPRWHSRDSWCATWARAGYFETSGAPDAIWGIFESGSEILCNKCNKYVCLLQQFQKTSELLRHFVNFRIALGSRSGTFVGIKISALMTFRSGTM